MKDEFVSKIFQDMKLADIHNSKPPKKGFTAIEILIAVGILGILALALIPSVRNAMETRSLENTARDVQTVMQRAKFQAVKTKLNHRVRFFDSDGRWYFIVERQDISGNWDTMPGFIRKKIPTRFNVDINLPDVVSMSGKAVVFSQLGFISNFDASKNSITLQSDKLKVYNQPDKRIVRAFSGGSLLYAEQKSE